MRVNLVPESAHHLEMTRARQMRVDTRDLAEAELLAEDFILQPPGWSQSGPAVLGGSSGNYQSCHLINIIV